MQDLDDDYVSSEVPVIVLSVSQWQRANVNSGVILISNTSDPTECSAFLSYKSAVS